MPPVMPDLEAPPLNERGLIDLVSPIKSLTILLTPDDTVFLPNGSSRIAEKGRSVDFRQSRATITLEDFELLRRVPAWTGEGEPKLAFFAHEHRLQPGADGRVTVVDGAQNTAMGNLSREPIRGWDTMSYSAIRTALKDGLVREPLDALVYERTHKDREGVILLLLAAARGEGKLPTANQMRAADRQAGADLGDEEDDEDTTPAEPPPAAAAAPPALTDAELRAQIEAELASGGDGLGVIDTHIAGDAAEPIPSEGVV